MVAVLSPLLPTPQDGIAPDRSSFKESARDGMERDTGFFFLCGVLSESDFPLSPVARIPDGWCLPRG